MKTTITSAYTLWVDYNPKRLCAKCCDYILRDYDNHNQGWLLRLNVEIGEGAQSFTETIETEIVLCEPCMELLQFSG